MINIVIGLFFLLDGKTGEMVDAPLVTGYESLLACEDKLTYFKTEAAKQTFPIEVVGICIEGQDIQ